MRELMAQDPAHLSIKSESVISVCTETQLYRLASVDVKPQQLWVLMWGELSKNPNGELVDLHDVLDGRVLGELGEQSKCACWVGEVVEGLQLMEAVI